MVPPSVFIPLAEDIGLISDLTRHMLRTAGEMLQTWSDDPILRNSSVAVNVSPVEFARGRLVQSVADTITEFAIRPGQLVLELTESHELIGDESGNSTVVFRKVVVPLRFRILHSDPKPG